MKCGEIYMDNQNFVWHMLALKSAFQDVTGGVLFFYFGCALRCAHPHENQSRNGQVVLSIDMRVQHVPVVTYSRDGWWRKGTGGSCKSGPGLVQCFP